MTDEPTLKDLQDRARELEIEGFSKLNKIELAAKIQEVEEERRRAETVANAEFPGEDPEPHVTVADDQQLPAPAPDGSVVVHNAPGPRAQSTEAQTYGDDSYSVEQLIEAPDLFEPHHAGSAVIRTALRRADADRQQWTLRDAQAAVANLLGSTPE